MNLYVWCTIFKREFWAFLKWKNVNSQKLHFGGISWFSFFFWIEEKIQCHWLGKNSFSPLRIATWKLVHTFHKSFEVSFFLLVCWRWILTSTLLQNKTERNEMKNWKLFFYHSFLLHSFYESYSSPLNGNGMN